MLSERANDDKCFGNFLKTASMLENISPIFSSFNPFPALPSVATDDRKQFQCCKIVFNSKTRTLFFEFN